MFRKHPPTYPRRPISQHGGALGQTRRGPVPDPEHVVQQHRRSDVEDDVGPSDAKVAPSFSVADVDAGEELVGAAEGAVATVGGGVGVLELAHRSGGEIVREVLAAGL